MLPSKYVAAVMIGQGFIGLVLNGISAICKLIFGSDTKISINYSTLCFYIIMLVIMIFIAIISIV